MEAKEGLLEICKEYLSDKITDTSTPDMLKSELIKRLFKLDTSIKSVLLVVNYKDRRYKKEIFIRHLRSDYPELRVWRKNVLERDGHQCQQCGSKKRLEAHHIKSWKDHILERFDVSNGLTLCKRCHSKTDNYGNRNNAIR